MDPNTMFAPKQGKQATKGQKQIESDNKKTIKTYSTMAAGALAFKCLFWLIGWSHLNVSLTIFSIIIYTVTLFVMNKTADLNLKGGFAEYLKDVIITTVGCTSLSVISNLFWILWLWLPAFWTYKFWMSVVAPWIFAPAPEELSPEVSDKKRKKMERKMARAGYR